MINQSNTENTIGVAVDVGSTSIAVCCVDLCHKIEILSFSFSNPQSVYGTDVITRIQHCLTDEQKFREMRTLVEKMLDEKLKERLGQLYYNIAEIVYSGNTTMLHILRGLSVKGLATAPFCPVNIEYEQIKVAEFKEHNLIENGNENLTHIYLPGISAFVGADILGAVQYLQMGKSDTFELLIDLGTNGELLLLNKEKGYATSTACGPVFDHAVSGARYGSESITAIANCVKRGLIDSSGRLMDAFFEKGISIDENFTIKQENIRNFQLAKGAIYAGIQCLLKKAGIHVDEVQKVYISGGLGFYMNQRDAFTLKMLPDEFKNKIIVSGNTSLEGAKQILILKPNEKIQLLREYTNIRKRTECFELANVNGFQECYMNSLDF